MEGRHESNLRSLEVMNIGLADRSRSGSKDRGLFSDRIELPRCNSGSSMCWA